MTPLFWVEITFEWCECHGVPCFHFFFFFFFSLETTLQENNWMKMTSVALMVFFFESVIPKVLDHSYLQSSLLTITRHLDNGIWSTPYNWRLYRHGCQACTKTFNFVIVSLIKDFLKLNVVSCEGLQPQNVIFLFSMKRVNLLTVKTTDVNNSL